MTRDSAGKGRTRSEKAAERDQISSTVVRSASRTAEMNLPSSGEGRGREEEVEERRNEGRQGAVAGIGAGCSAVSRACRPLSER